MPESFDLGESVFNSKLPRMILNYQNQPASIGTHWSALSRLDREMLCRSSSSALAPKRVRFRPLCGHFRRASALPGSARRRHWGVDLSPVPIQGCRGSLPIHTTIASTTAAGCSGIRAWLAFGITMIVARSPNSSLISFIIARGLKGSSAACRSSSGAAPPDHHSDCLVARPAANWASSTSGCQPFSHTPASLPGAKKAVRRYYSRSASGSAMSPAFFTASDSSFAPAKPAG